MGSARAGNADVGRPESRGAVFAFHHESVARLNATPEIAFHVLDDFKSLSAHMGKRSLMMLGSTMSIDMDALGGRAPGSRVTMEGRVLGISLSLQEVVIQRDPPFRKVWQTTRVHLLAIGHYRLGFTLSPERSGSRLQVFIDYDLPPGCHPCSPDCRRGSMLAGASAGLQGMRREDSPRTLPESAGAGRGDNARCAHSAAEDRRPEDGEDGSIGARAGGRARDGGHRPGGKSQRRIGQDDPAL